MFFFVLPQSYTIVVTLMAAFAMLLSLKLLFEPCKLGELPVSCTCGQRWPFTWSTSNFAASQSLRAWRMDGLRVAAISAALRSARRTARSGTTERSPSAFAAAESSSQSAYVWSFECVLRDALGMLPVCEACPA